MQKINFIIPNNITDLDDLPIFNSGNYSLDVFDNEVLSFLDELSRCILKDKDINNLPEIVALGFWLRKSNLQRLRKENKYQIESEHFKLSPRGKVLHICPSNVDTMFVYSLVVSLLVGNKNILRLSSNTEEPHINKLFIHIKKLIDDKFQNLNSYINIIKYPRDKDINEQLSIKVNARLIWGGDRTIETFKNFATQPRTKDIVFPDRLSLMILKSERILELEGKEQKEFINLFFNDSYTFNQLGCSSPQVVMFLGKKNHTEKALDLIVQHLNEKIELNDFDIPSIASLKFNKMVDDSIASIISEKKGNNIVTFLEIEGSVKLHTLKSCGGGYFYKKNIHDLNEVESLNHSKIQTITHFGLSDEEISQLTKLAFGEGIDRIVPLGKALEFDYLWDGYNLFEELSRKIAIK